ncbi:hypothetical protein KPH14_006319 [Odynerus spinipes]|uniref:Uncharacterized protein n=1 Tax=Odynerus spinipes TaxID=1348599 RepID=A0AAD9RYZ4_9HYME|nr:hypothetical protein KPH14_006319 [Odynerus spinipes]
MLGETCLEKNGVGKFERTLDDTKSTRMGMKTLTGEQIFICLMFVFSMSVVVGKLYINYELVNKRLYSEPNDPLDMDVLCPSYGLSNLTSISNLSESIVKQLAMTGTQFINITSQYEKAIADMVVTASTKYEWLLKAILSGLIMTGFSWFIIYMDSRIPGVDPPFPFSLFKRRVQRIQKDSHINHNYLIGALVGLLVFICMCFDR